MKRTTILQLILTVIFIACGLGAIGFGQNIHTFQTTMMITPGSQSGFSGGETGFNGGAIALGIISAAALISAVWLEIVQMKNK